MTAKWAKVKGAKKYIVSYKAANGNWKTVKTTKTSLTIKKLKKGKKYTVKVTAAKTLNGIDFKSAASNTKTVKVK